MEVHWGVQVHRAPHDFVAAKTSKAMVETIRMTSWLPCIAEALYIGVSKKVRSPNIDPKIVGLF